MKMLLLTLIVLLSNLASTEGVKLSYEKQNPTPADKNTCAILTCMQELVDSQLYVKSIDIVNIDQSGSKLITVFAHTDNTFIADEVSLLNRSFTLSLASVQLAIHNSSICNRGSFLCEVTYINDEFRKKSEISIIRPNSESSCSESVQEKLDSLTSTVLSLKSSVDQFKKCAVCQTVIPGEDFPDAWTLAFRGTPYINKSVYEAYKSGAGIPENVEAGCRQVDSGIPCTNHYRNNDIFSKWQTVNRVAFVLYERNVAVAYMLFNGQGTDYMNWFSKTNLQQSSWTDLKTSDTNYFSIDGDMRPSQNIIRQFIVHKQYGGCPGDWGWFVAVETKTPYCPWEATENFPAFVYAKGSQVAHWSTGSVGHADVMAIFVK